MLSAVLERVWMERSREEGAEPRQPAGVRHVLPTVRKLLFPKRGSGLGRRWG